MKEEVKVSMKVCLYLTVEAQTDFELDQIQTFGLRLFGKGSKQRTRIHSSLFRAGHNRGA